MSRSAFWKTTPILLKYKRPLALASVGLFISTVCFAGGMTLLLLVINTLLAKPQPLPEIVHEWAQSHLAPPHEAPLWLLRSPEAMQWLHDRAWDFGSSLPTDPFIGFVLVMVTIAVLSIIGSLGRYVHELYTVTITLHAARRWRGQLFRRLIHAPMDQVLQTGNADHISRLLSDTANVTTGYQAIMGRALPEILKAIVSIAIAFVVNWQLTGLALFGAPLLAILLRKFAKRIRRSTKRALRQRGHMLAALKEALGGIAVVKVHNAEGYERRRFSRINRELLVQHLKARQAKALAGPVVDTLTLLAVIVAATFAAWLIMRAGSGANPRDLIGVLVLLGAAGASLKPIASLNNDLSEAAAAAERVMQAMELSVEPTGIDAKADAPDLARHQRDIVVENVEFHYPNKTSRAVAGVSLHVDYGQTVAIVGGNGSGKTTLLSLLVRLFTPTSGRVLVDGVDIQSIDLRSLRSQIAVVTQQTTLFEGTIADNIAYGRRHTPMEKIVAAAKAAYADEFIRALPQGYDTLLGEDGSGLSGGQKQRISIARAILRDPAILILDEATSQIDGDSELKINQAIRDMRHGRTIFVIAHRLATVIDSDVIVVMADGKIIDQGKHDELLKRCLEYQVLTQTQLRKPGSEA